MKVGAYSTAWASPKPTWKKRFIRNLTPVRKGVGHELDAPHSNFKLTPPNQYVHSPRRCWTGAVADFCEWCFIYSSCHYRTHVAEIGRSIASVRAGRARTVLRIFLVHQPSMNRSPTSISAPPPPLWSLVAVPKRWRRQQHWSRAVAQANKPPPVPTSSPRRRYSAASASTRLRHIAASPPPGERHTQRLTPHTLSMPSFMGSAHSKPGASNQF